MDSFTSIIWNRLYNSRDVTQLITIWIELVDYATQTDSDKGVFAALYQMPLSHLCIQAVMACRAGHVHSFDWAFTTRWLNNELV